MRLPSPALPALLFVLCPAATLLAQTAARPDLPPVDLQVRDTTRVESWQYFDPKPGGGNPDYTFPATRLFASLDFRRPSVDVVGAVQYVQFANLPAHSIGPGPLGTGPQYFDQSGSTTSNSVYLRLLNVRLLHLPGRVTLQAGRFGYASGAESPSGDSKIEAVKRMRVDSRLIGEFEWSLYQRTFDGARADADRSAWHASLTWFRPTQGGFEEDAGAPLRHVEIGAATFTFKPSRRLRHTDWQSFVYRYDDARAVTARPDNSGLAATSASVHITTLGTSVVGAYPIRRGQLDVLGWFAGQTGRWYGQPHRAGAAALEAGYQWTTAPGRPWIRGGWFRSSGDGDPADGRHTTFFQMLPTTRRYSLSTTYNLMNLSETFVQATAKVRGPVSLRADLHRLRLTNAADLWYAGSGATQSAGKNFGFAGRSSNGSTDLGTMLEGSADWTITPHLSLNAYLGWLRGGAVVTGTFAGSRLRFGYFETIVAF